MLQIVWPKIDCQQFNAMSTHFLLHLDATGAAKVVVDRKRSAVKQEASSMQWRVRWEVLSSVALSGGEWPRLSGVHGLWPRCENRYRHRHMRSQGNRPGDRNMYKNLILHDSCMATGTGMEMGASMRKEKRLGWHGCRIKFGDVIILEAGRWGDDDNTFIASRWILKLCREVVSMSVTRRSSGAVAKSQDRCGFHDKKFSPYAC